MLKHLKVLFAVIPVFFLFVSLSAMADPLKAVSVKGFGEYGNDAGLLIDGTVPPEETEYMDPVCVYWDSDETYFLIDMGKIFMIEGITLQADNNDDYYLEASEDGKVFLPLLSLSSDSGEIDYGMDTLSTIKDDPEYVPEAVLVPIRARFLKLRAGGGDVAYAVSEVTVFGSDVAISAQPAPVLAPALSSKPSQDMERIFDAMDVDHDGKVSLDEYAAVWKDKLDVAGNFAFFDKDKSGYIEKAEYLGLAEKARGEDKSMKKKVAPELPMAPVTPRAGKEALPQSSPMEPDDMQLPPALQGGISLKLDPEKVKNALAAIAEWPELRLAAETGNTSGIDAACKKYHFDNWFELNMTMSRVCNIGGQLMSNPESKAHLTSTYGTEAIEILSTPEAREKLGGCPQ